MKKIRNILLNIAALSLLLAMFTLLTGGVQNSASQVAEASTGDTTVAVSPTLRISPHTQNAWAPGSFTVDVAIDNATDLGSFEFRLSYDPTIIQATSGTLNPFLGSTGRAASSLGPAIDQAAGTIYMGGFSFGSATGPNGSGTLATLTFSSKEVGNSSLTFMQGQTTDTKGVAQSPILQSGTVTLTKPPYSLYVPAIMR